MRSHSSCPVDGLFFYNHFRLDELPIIYLFAQMAPIHVQPGIV